MKLNQVDDTVVRKYIRTHNNIVQIFASTTGCVVNFPKRVQHPSFDSYAQEYDINEDGNLFVNGEKINCPSYAVRTFIFSDVASTCRAMGYSPTIIEFVVGEEEVDEDEFFCTIPINLSKEDEDKEMGLRTLFVEAIKGGFDPKFDGDAKKIGVARGFQLVKSQFVGE